MIDVRRVERYARLLEFRFRRTGVELFAGRHRSVCRGQGLTFAECRDYRFGDEVRHVEWNATARLGRPFVKVFDEDRTATLLLLVDVSRSLLFGQGMSKSDVVRELAALFALIGTTGTEEVGAVLFSDYVERCIWPGGGEVQGRAMVRVLERYVPTSGGTSIAGACWRALKMLKRPGTVVIFSDFLDTGYDRALSALARRHDVLAVVVIDRREAELPPLGLVRVRDLESGRDRWVDTSSKRAREAQRQRFREWQQARRELFVRIGVPSIELSTDRPYLGALLQFCRPRGRLGRTA